VKFGIAYFGERVGTCWSALFAQPLREAEAFGTTPHTAACPKAKTKFTSSGRENNKLTIPLGFLPCLLILTMLE